VLNRTCPSLTTCPFNNPSIFTTTEPPACIARHVSASGRHIRICACSAVSFGASFVFERQRSSISPTRFRSPFTPTTNANPPSPVTVARHAVAPLASRNNIVGAANPGGKIVFSKG